MKTWSVTLPIGGHASIDVQAETAESAIELATEIVQKRDITEWKVLQRWTARAELAPGETPDEPEGSAP